MEDVVTLQADERKDVGRYELQGVECAVRFALPQYACIVIYPFVAFDIGNEPGIGYGFSVGLPGFGGGCGPAGIEDTWPAVAGRVEIFK